MDLGILGTGRLAAALGTAWSRAGHSLTIAGRSPDRAAALARNLSARSASPREAVVGRDAVLLAVSWLGAPEMLAAAGASDGTLAGGVLIDPTNAVEHGIGMLLTDPGTSEAQQISGLAPGAQVVKAFHLFPADHWLNPPERLDEGAAMVPICGDSPSALEIVGQLVRDAGANPAVLGPLTRARQLEEVAGFVIGLAFSGVDPNAAIPRLNP
jgi:8-hydroxy-5-deazaflavin:NADPH oxidoreductase